MKNQLFLRGPLAKSTTRQINSGHGRKQSKSIMKGLKSRHRPRMQKSEGMCYIAKQDGATSVLLSLMQSVVKAQMTTLKKPEVFKESHKMLNAWWDIPMSKSIGKIQVKIPNYTFSIRNPYHTQWPVLVKQAAKQIGLSFLWRLVQWGAKTLLPPSWEPSDPD